MALNPLTLSTTAGVQGRPFQAVVGGLSAGSSLEIGGDGSPGFSTVNGNVMSTGLPYPVSTAVLRETLPGTGVRETRVDITGATRADLLALADAAIGAGRTLVRYRVSGDRQSDGSFVYSVRVEDDLGATVGVAVTPTPTPTPTLTGFYANGVKLQKMSDGVLGVLAKTRRAIWAMLGDSLTAGWGAALATGTGAGADPGGAGYSRVKAYPKKLATLLTSAGVPSRADAVFGNGISTNNTVAEYTAANPSVTFGSGWDIAINTLGGMFFHSSGGGAMTFAPDFAADRFDLYITGFAGLGTFTVSDASGVLATVSESVANGITAYQTVTISRPVSSKLPISIARTGAGGDIYIGAIVPYDTTAPRLELWNMGWAGSKSSDWTAGTDQSDWAPYKALGSITPDLLSIELGANDSNAGVAAATYKSNLQTIINNAHGNLHDIWMMKANPATTGSDGYNLTSAYLTAIDEIGAANGGVPALNYNGGLTLVTEDYYDNIHLSDQGQTKKAQYAASMITFV